MTTGGDPPQSQTTGELGDASQQRPLDTSKDACGSDVDVSCPGPVQSVSVRLSPPDWPESEAVFYV